VEKGSCHCHHGIADAFSVWKPLEPTVLFVDDELNILNAFKRQLRGRFSIDIAGTGQTALEMLEKNTGYAVIASDMHMPGMDGIEFLRNAQAEAPESVRLMLTGNHDQDLAVKAINEGHIFRFLNKPCSTDDLTRALDACLAQHRLITAERDLLQKTLTGSVKVLTDILSMTDPASFGQRMNLRAAIRELAPHLAIRNPWDIELAAMLGDIGAVVIPDTIMAKHRKGLPLSDEERQLLASIPEKGKDLLSNIPRLEQVAKIVHCQNKNYDGSGFPPDGSAGKDIPLGARVIRVLRDLYALESGGAQRSETLRTLAQRPGLYDPALLNLLSLLEDERAGRKPGHDPFAIKVSQLCPGQVVLANVETSDGVLLLARGNQITPMILSRLKNYHRFVGLKEPILVDVMIPTITREEQ
jgi:response regulator RpfG family c-di-GMP phosphodiesterase